MPMESIPCLWKGMRRTIKRERERISYKPVPKDYIAPVDKEKVKACKLERRFSLISRWQSSLGAPGNGSHSAGNNFVRGRICKVAVGREQSIPHPRTADASRSPWPALE